MARPLTFLDDHNAAFYHVHRDLSKPEILTPHEMARQQITRFAERYATTPRQRSDLQLAIDASQPLNCPVAPSERYAHVMTYTHLFEHALRRDSSINEKQRGERLARLRHDLMVIESPFALPTQQQRSR